MYASKCVMCGTLFICRHEQKICEKCAGDVLEASCDEDGCAVSEATISKGRFGNGALQALRRYCSEENLAAGDNPIPRADHILAWLWQEGFKIVPLPDETAE